MTFRDFSAKEERINKFIKKGVGTYNGHADFDLPEIKVDRAELRRQQKKEDKITLTQKQLDSRINAALDDQMHEMMLSMSRFVCVLWCMTLHDMDGFGGKRLGDRTKRVDDLMDTISKDYTTFEDMRDAIAEETQFFITLKGDRQL